MTGAEHHLASLEIPSHLAPIVAVLILDAGPVDIR
jgi:hypothetical protein